ncbi:SGNH/GDSL hydrolase family protein [Tundrisphaera sp. TA3]|uniref:SGNH/GDSL hydrolase family protein n=1 Tax=Tundrisphaera sp. TA3 TaxID=3435775 RepID=UPI003EB9F5CE
MRRSIFLWCGILASSLGGASASGDPPRFELADGDRVVLVGSTLVEREPTYGYLETRLTARSPGKSVTFRNLGWSADTVRGVSRPRQRNDSGPLGTGFDHLKAHVETLRPTVLVVGYGGADSFDGEPGLAAFAQGLEGVLALAAPTKARVVILGPNRQEHLAPPMPDPARHNADLARYRDVLRDAASRRGEPFVDLFARLDDGARSKPPHPLTDNGLHFNAYGYWRMAAAVEEGLGLEPAPWAVRVKDGKVEADGAEVFGVAKSDGGITFRLQDAVLPAPPAPDGSPARAADARVLRASGLAPGRHALKIDGHVVATADARAWASGVTLARGPEFDQVEALRGAIIAKNLLYFHRWRPQNETYLYGFRKHEQGQNAREIPEFDPLVSAKEAEIARLRVPEGHTYELSRADAEAGR